MKIHAVRPELPPLKVMIELPQDEAELLRDADPHTMRVFLEALAHALRTGY